VVDVETLKAEYQVTKRAMTFTIKINNRSDKAIQIGEFSTANVRFLNKDLTNQHQGVANSVVAPEGLSLDNAEPIKPKEQRTMTITASDALWESEQLDGLIRDADSRIGGLLFFMTIYSVNVIYPASLPL